MTVPEPSVCATCHGEQTVHGFACPDCVCLCCESEPAVTAGLCRDCHVAHTTPAPCGVCGGSRWMLVGMLPGGLPLQQRCTACATPVARLAKDMEA